VAVGHAQAAPDLAAADRGPGRGAALVRGTGEERGRGRPALKILLIYYEPQASGQTTHVLSLARGLDRRRYAATVALPERLEHSIAALQQSGVEVVPLL